MRGKVRGAIFLCARACRGINCVAATIQLAGRGPATFDCSVDRRFGDACGPWLYFGHIGGLTVRMAKILVALDGKDGVQ